MNENQKTTAFVNGEIDLLRVMKLFLQNLHWLVLAGIVVGVGVYLTVTLLVTPAYESRVSFYICNSTAAQTGIISSSDLQAAESLAITCSKILESNSVLDAVLNDQGVERHLTREALRDMVGVSVISDTQLLEVVVTSTDPQMACRVANSFARVAPAEIVRITKAGSAEVVDWPEVAAEPSSPRPVLDGAIGFAIGMLLLATVILLPALADTTIYTPEDLEDTLGVIVLGQIPDLRVGGETDVGWTLTEGGAVLYGQTEKQPEGGQ